MEATAPPSALNPSQTSGVFGHVLLILPHAEHGFCLKYSAEDFRTDEWISLHDPSDLLRTVPALDDWSVGLFLPGQRALLAVSHFAREGTRDPGTRWVDAAELPGGANRCSPP